MKQVRQRVEGVARAQPAYGEVGHPDGQAEVEWRVAFGEGRRGASAIKAIWPGWRAGRSVGSHPEPLIAS
jgi:hypothetical protein